MRKTPCTWSDATPLFRHGDVAGHGRSGLLDFSVSLNPLGPPPAVYQALQRECLEHGTSVPSAIECYPDPDCENLTELLARRHRVAPAQVIVGNGANDLIYATSRALRPRRVAIVEPTYTEYLRASLRVGATVEHWLPDEDAYQPRPFDPQGADLVWLANPNNPTGRLWVPGELAPWIAAHPHTLFVVDEAFLPFRPDETDHTLIPALDRLANLVVLRSLTKIYTLPGLRLGYAVTSVERAAGIRAEIVPWSVNALAQVAGLAALEDGRFLARTHSWLAEERPSFAAGLRACSSRLEPLASEANFILVRLHGIRAGCLTRRLAERGLAVRDAANFIGLDPCYLRVAVRLPEDNRRLLAGLREILAQA